MIIWERIMAVETPIKEEVVLESLINSIGEYCVLIYNDDHNSFDHVIRTLMMATECDQKEAKTEAEEAHCFGKAACHFASEEECNRICQLILNAGIKASVERDPVLM